MANTVQLTKNGQPVFPVTDVSLVMGLQDAIKLPPVKVATLPTASADTAGKMYYVGPDENDEYERYITSAVNGAYEWIDLGDTAIPLPSIADNLTTNDPQTALSAAQGKVLDGKVSQLGQEVNGLNLQNSKTYTGNQEKEILSNINIPAGTPFSLKLSSDTISWTRAGVTFNGTWGAGSLSFVVENDVEIAVSGKAFDITSVYFYIISGFSGSGNVSISIVANNGLISRIEALEVDNSVGTNKVQDGAITIEKLGEGAAEEVYSKNLCNKAAIEPGYYFYWAKTENADLAITEPIAVAPGEKYCVSGMAARMVAFLASPDDVHSLGGEEYPSNPITVPAGANYMIVTIKRSYESADLQIEKGETPTAYVPYSEPFKQIYIRNGQITSEKIAEGVSLPASPRQFNTIAVGGTLAPAQSLTTDATYNLSKNTVEVAKISGAIVSVSVGRNYNAYSGEWAEITATQLITKYGEAGAVNQSFNHGLTLGDLTTIIIDKKVTNDALATATITIINDAGDMFQQVVTWWGSSMGIPFVRNNNSAGDIVASLSFFVGDLTKKIWVFGDSYVGYDNNSRWPYYPLVWGYDNFLLNGRGGENAQEAYSDFTKLLACGQVPSYCVWCMGMNSGRDESGAVNSIWLATTQSFISKCAELGIVPILATIPTVPTEIHTKLNEWVRASGYRYIDFAAAVENTEDNYWRYWGTANALLSSDEVHPSTRGALELAAKVLIDFPEITIRQN